MKKLFFVTLMSAGVLFATAQEPTKKCCSSKKTCTEQSKKECKDGKKSCCTGKKSDHAKSETKPAPKN